MTAQSEEPSQHFALPLYDVSLGFRYVGFSGTHTHTQAVLCKVGTSQQFFFRGGQAASFTFIPPIRVCVG